MRLLQLLQWLRERLTAKSSNPSTEEEKKGAVSSTSLPWYHRWLMLSGKIKGGSRWLKYLVPLAIIVVACQWFVIGKRPYVLQGVLLLVVGILVLLRMTRGSLAQAEIAFKKRLAALEAAENVTQMPSKRLREVLQPHETVKIELRMSPLSMIHGDPIWRGFGDVGTVLVYVAGQMTSGVRRSSIRRVISSILVLVELTAVFATLILVSNPATHLALLLLVLACLCSVAYRYARWRIRTVVVTNQRVILIDGVFGHDQTFIPLGKITNVSIDEKPVARWAAHLRLTDLVLGKLIIESAGRNSEIHVGLLPATVFQASGLIVVPQFGD